MMKKNTARVRKRKSIARDESPVLLLCNLARKIERKFMATWEGERMVQEICAKTRNMKDSSSPCICRDSSPSTLARLLDLLETSHSVLCLQTPVRRLILEDLFLDETRRRNKN